MAAITCPACGCEIPSSANFCPNCGNPVSEPDRVGLPSSLKEGQRFTLGKWGGAPIEWRVLRVFGSQACAISEYGLDCVQFNSSPAKENDWLSSDLKAWLTATFLPKAFDPAIRGRISEITCLSLGEAEDCFGGDGDRICKPTAYAIQQGAYAYGNGGGCCWWLRSPGSGGAELAAYVWNDGGINPFGAFVGTLRHAVRPAIWLDL